MCGLIAHRGELPRVADGCYIAPTAIVRGDVEIAAGSVVMDFAVVTAESAPVKIGKRCVVMEHAVVRGAGEHPTSIGDHVLVGPHAHITGAIIGDCCMFATRATVFNGAIIESGCLVAIGAIVHIATQLPRGSRVPMQHIAIGAPAKILPPAEAPTAHAIIEKIGFTKTVFNFDTSGKTMEETMRLMCSTYSASIVKSGENLNE